MHFDLSLLTALAVFLNVGASLARVVLKDNTDRAKIDRIEAGVSQVLGAVTTVAGVLNAAPPAPAPERTRTDTPTMNEGGTPHAGA